MKTMQDTNGPTTEKIELSDCHHLHIQCDEKENQGLKMFEK